MSNETYQLYKNAQPRPVLVTGPAVGKSTTLALKLMAAQNAKAFACFAGEDIGEALEVAMARAIRIDAANRDAYFLKGLHEMRKAFGPLQRHHMPMVRAMASVIENLPPLPRPVGINTIITNAEKKDRSLAGRGAHIVCHDEYGPNLGGDAFP